MPPSGSHKHAPPSSKAVGVTMAIRVHEDVLVDLRGYGGVGTVRGIGSVN
jgi:hypothetical protein